MIAASEPFRKLILDRRVRRILLLCALLFLFYAENSVTFDEETRVPVSPDLSHTSCRNSAIVLISGRLRTFNEPLVTTSQAHNFHQPLKQTFGDACVAVYLCTSLQDTVDYAAHIETLTPVLGIRQVFGYAIDYGKLGAVGRMSQTKFSGMGRLPNNYFQQAFQWFRCYEDSITHLRSSYAWELDTSKHYIIKTRPDLFWFAPFNATQLVRDSEPQLHNNCLAGRVFGRLAEGYWAKRPILRSIDGRPADEVDGRAVNVIDSWSLWDYNCDRRNRPPLQLVLRKDWRLTSCRTETSTFEHDPSYCLDDMFLVWSFPSLLNQTVLDSEKFLWLAKQVWNGSLVVSQTTPCRCGQHYWMWGGCDMQVSVISVPFGIARSRNETRRVHDAFRLGNFMEVMWWNLTSNSQSSSLLARASQVGHVQRSLCSVDLSAAAV